MKKALVLLTLTAAIAPALASTDCTINVQAVWWDTVNIWVTAVPPAAPFYIPQTDPNAKNLLAEATVALVTGRPVTARFSTSNVDCTPRRRRGASHRSNCLRLKLRIILNV